MKNLLKTIRMNVASFLVKVLCDPYQQYVVGQALTLKGMQIPEVRAAFIKQFGANRNDRSAQQWRNLVAAYGLDTVCKIENMTKQAVQLKMNSDLQRQNFNNLKKSLKAAK